MSEIGVFLYKKLSKNFTLCLLASMWFCGYLFDFIAFIIFGMVNAY